MFKFIGGFVLGAVSLYIYSSKVRKDAKEAGKGMFSRYVQRPIIDAEYRNY